MNNKPIKSVLELARFKVGDIGYKVSLRTKNEASKDIEEWVYNYHPKVLYERKYDTSWKSRSPLPKLASDDFDKVTRLLTTRFEIDKFQIKEVIRSNHTGEFLYANEKDEWIPEEYLLDTIVAARKERDRIKKMISNWAKI